MRKTRVALMLILAATTGCAGTKHAQRPPQAQEVLGTVAVAFIPVNSGSVPQPPIDLTLLITDHRNGSKATVDIADGSATWELTAGEPPKAGAVLQNFNLILPPGEYSITAFGVRSKSLSEKMVFLPSAGPKFTVPESRCSYIGRINATFLRLAPGSLEQAKAASAEVSASIGYLPLVMIYLPQGALLLWTSFRDLPLEDGRTRADDYSKQVLEYARQKQCVLPTRPNADEKRLPPHQQAL